MAWLLLHIVLLIGFRNRLLVLINWAWDYFLYDRAVRLIHAREIHTGPAEARRPPRAAPARGRRSGGEEGRMNAARIERAEDACAEPFRALREPSALAAAGLFAAEGRLVIERLLGPASRFRCAPCSRRRAPSRPRRRPSSAPRPRRSSSPPSRTCSRRWSATRCTAAVSASPSAARRRSPRR